MNWLLLLTTTTLAAADLFTEQYRQLEQYYAQQAQHHSTTRPLAERLGTVTPIPAAAQRTLIAIWPAFRIEEIRLEAEPGHFAHALLLSPPKSSNRAIIAIGPADRSAEAWAGLAANTESPAWLRALVQLGYTVCLPIKVERTTGHPLSESTRGKDRRHILHRLGFVTGRSVTGLEVTEVRALAAWLKTDIGLYAEADGAFTALYAAAVDKRFSSLNLAAFSDPGVNAWRDPVDRTVYGQTSLPKPALRSLDLPSDPNPILPGERLLDIEIEERRNRHFNALVDFLRARIRQSSAERHRRHNLLATPPQQAVPKLLADLNELMGPIPTPVPRINARLTEIASTNSFKAFDVLLDVLPGVQAYGHLLVPHGSEGKHLPAVVAQHGLGGKPKDLTLQGPDPNAAYHGFAARLAEHGYVVFAPYVTVPIPQAELINPLARMAHALGRMRTNIEVAKLRRIVDFLESLSYVDRARLGYYGLSYGGYSAIWMAPLEPRLKATVVSGHFNDWTPKITNETERTSYLQHPDEDFYDWNVLNRLTHVELLAAFWPRAVMVEFAQHDGTTFPAWHERAWAEVEQVAHAWNAGDRIVRDKFIGIHEIHGIGAFDFLDRWLRPELPSSRDFPDWGQATETIDQNPLTWIRGTFRTGSRQPVFRGLAFRANAAITVLYGLTPGGRELGEVTSRQAGDWAEAPLPPRRLDPARLYYFELRATTPVTLSGPKPLGGTRFPGSFAVTYKPMP